VLLRADRAATNAPVGHRRLPRRGGRIRRRRYVMLMVPVHELATTWTRAGRKRLRLRLQKGQRGIPRRSRRRPPEASASSRQSQQPQRRKSLLSPGIPAYPRLSRKAMTGLSRRRSRVRVRSLRLLLHAALRTIGPVGVAPFGPPRRDCRLGASPRRNGRRIGKKRAEPGSIRASRPRTGVRAL
jgi:hypothetical protein